jgi:hypothetical protein
VRTLRHFFVASVLILMLGTSSIAGEISTGVAPSQPGPTPAPIVGQIEIGLNGDMHTGAPGDIHTGEAAADVALAEAVVGLVQGVLALL